MKLPMFSLCFRSPATKCHAHFVAAVGVLILLADSPGAAQKPAADTKSEYTTVVQPLIKKYCLTCHATRIKKGSLDLERFATLDQVRKDIKPWQQLIEMVEAGEMPPKEKPQPATEERRRLLTWTRAVVDAEARAR